MTNGGISAKVDADDYGRFASAAKGAEKDVQKALRKALRDTAKPLGSAVVRTGSAQMPSRGGLRAKLAGGKVGLAISLGNNPKVTLKLGAKPGIGLANLNRGTLRHPVYGRGKWVSQRVPAGTYDAAFEAGAPAVKRRVADAAQDVLDDIARKV
jgi:hypothetical protein